MKERIRTNLKMLEDNLHMFNDFALQFVDKKAIKKFISIWRWYVSHGNFNAKHQKPKGLCSNPSISWLNSQLQGLTVPLSKDIGLCIAPVVASSIATEHAARRIMGRLNMIYGYVSPEDAKADQEAHRARQDKKTKDRKRAADARAAREKIRLKPPTEEEYAKAGAVYLKEKEAYRKKRHKELEKAKEEELKRFENETRRIRARGD